MSELKISNIRTMPRGSAYHRNCLDEYRPPVASSRCNVTSGPDMKHSKSDDLVLQSAGCASSARSNSDSVSSCEMRGSASGNELLPVPVPVLLPRADCFSQCEPDNDVRFQVLDSTRIRGKDLQRKPSHHVGIYDRVDPEDSIRDMVSENDFYRFVLFKTHYDKYLHLSKKYEEARNIAYYLEEKYHEIKAERDGLAAARAELELELKRRLESRDQELHDKEEELFLQLERVVRLEEDCEKLRAEKEKFAQMKDALEKEKLDAYRRLKQQSRESEATRRGLERARQDVVRQVSAIAAEKDCLERENESLRQQLCGRRGADCLLLCDKEARELDKETRELRDLKLAARQSQSLNSQFKKGMKHLASCRLKKCHVCAYTKDAFGEYADRNDHKLFSCLQAPLQDWRSKRRDASRASGRGSARNSARSSSPSPYCSDEGEGEGEGEGELFSGRPGAGASPLPSCRSEYSFRRAYSSTAPSSPSPSPSHSLPLHCLGPHISYIDEASSSSGDSGQGEDACSGHCLVPTDASLASACSAASPGARAFSSDSGFSSELYESGSSKPSASASERAERVPFQRGAKWTASFRKLLTRVSSRKSQHSASPAQPQSSATR